MTDAVWQGALPGLLDAPRPTTRTAVATPMPGQAADGMAHGRFTGSARSFFGLLVRGSLLQIPTLGFYRFWLATDVRRHLWANTRIGQDAFEYTGTAKELLLGFLIAVAVLAPIYTIYFLLGLEAERLQAFASVPLFAILYVLGKFAAFRARRYRATRTVFRGVRFWMTGSGWAYARRALLWDLLTVVTLGIAYPWRAAALERYKMANTRYGNLHGSFAGTGGALFRRSWWMWLPGPFVVAALAVLAMFVAWSEPERIADAAALFAPVLLLWIAIAYPLFRAVEAKWWLDGLRLGDVSIVSDLRKGPVFRCYLITVLVGLAYGIVVSLGLAIVIGAFVASGVSFEHAPDDAKLVATGAGGLFYVTALLGLTVIKRLFLDRGLWKAVAGSVAVSNMAALDEVVAQGDAVGSFGEGFADALDVGGL